MHPLPLDHRRFLQARAVGTAGAARPASPAPASLRTIDIRMHLGALRVGRMASVEILLEAMDAHGVERAGRNAGQSER